MPLPQNVTETLYPLSMITVMWLGPHAGADKLVEKFKKLQKLEARVILGPQEQLNFTKP